MVATISISRDVFAARTTLTPWLAREIIASSEAQVKRIYGGSYNNNQEFYDFWRGLQVLEQSIDKNTKLVISDDSKLFKLFKD